MKIIKRHKKNSIPFLILLLIHTFMLGYTFYRKKDRKRLFILLLSGTGFCFLFEYLVLSLFSAYRYKPKIFRNKELDNLLGALLSQAVFIPFTAVYLTAFKLGWKGKLFFAIYFSGVEKLFLKLKVHQNNWWKTSFTITLLPLFFFINDWWYKHLKVRTPIVQFGSLFLGIMVNSLNFLYSRSIFRNIRFGLWRWHDWKQHFKIAPIYSIILSFATAIIIKNNSFDKGFLKAVSIAKLLDYSLYKTRFGKHRFRQITASNSIHIIMIYLAVYLKRLIYIDILKEKE